MFSRPNINVPQVISGLPGAKGPAGLPPGGWPASDPLVTQRLMSKLLEKVAQDKRSVSELSPAVLEFKKLVDDTPILRDGFGQMFKQTPLKPLLDTQLTVKPQIADFDTMYKMCDHIITYSFPHDEEDLSSSMSALYELPRATIGSLPVATSMAPELNVQFENMFNERARFLLSSKSCTYLTTNEDGWFGPAARAHMPNFEETYVCDPGADHFGFTSWDDFFTRQFREGVRPVVSPDDNNIIHSACEAALYNISHNIKEQDSFLIKGESLSLRDILNDGPNTDMFVGGSIFQAYLNPYDYHRWSSPVNGIIDKIDFAIGTYYGTPTEETPTENLPWAMRHSSYTRALIYIQPDNPSIGQIAFVAAGLADSSTCDVTVYEGQKVSKGDQLGMFHFGGSTHCLIFRKDANITFNEDFTAPGGRVPLNAPIAVVGGN
ncbi:unnamed protein product [Rhizoctonia solani]|uniref:L-tryptophan decarboxylase PsiD-like domain-containing protein n=1 Tax=Rhizoctonia solani TaxID=456999 RepID=A0A8H3DS29_9AGAM|nr:unnamed protein product [Rhizoctonia solani]